MRWLLYGSKFKVALSVTVALILGVVFASLSRNASSPLTTAAAAVFSPLNSLASYVSGAVRDFGASFTSSSVYIGQIEELNSQAEEYEKQLADYERLKEKVKTYEEFLELKQRNPDYKFVYASVISRDAADALSTFVLSCGSADGVSVNDPVLYNEFIVGIVKKVNATTCVAMSITDPRVSAGAYELYTGERGYVEGDVALFSQGTLRLCGLKKTTAVVSGGTVCSSGSGGVFPKDLIIGDVVSLESEPGATTSYAVVKPRVSINDLSQVFVLTDFDGKGIKEDFSVGEGSDD